MYMQLQHFPLGTYKYKKKSQKPNTQNDATYILSHKQTHEHRRTNNTKEQKNKNE